MFHIPIRPDYRDEWDGYTVDEVRSPYPPRSAALVRARRLAYEELRRQEAAQRAAERRTTKWLLGVLAFSAVVALICVIVTVVHP